jgi:DNA-binding NarL/FixJ family response regulator
MPEVHDPRMAPISVLIVDDHLMVAESLRRALLAEGDIEVVAVAGNAAEALEATAAHRPDVVVMDYQLPDADGAVAATRIRAAFPDTNVVMLTGSQEPSALQAALEAGCVGYIEKTSGLHKLALTVRSAASGDPMIVPPDLGRLLVARAGTWRSATTLTQREIEVLQLAAEGSSNQAIAERLRLSVNTVRTHLQRTLTKLGAHSKLEAVAVARKRGLLRDQ